MTNKVIYSRRANTFSRAGVGSESGRAGVGSDSKRVVSNSSSLRRNAR